MAFALGAEHGEEAVLAGQVSLRVAPRSVLGKQVKQLRRGGIIPANIYGRHQPSQPLQVDSHALERFLAGHNATRVVNLHVDGSDGVPLNALVRHVARRPRDGKILHVDFLRVSMDEPVTARVPLVLKGEAPAVAAGGVLLHMLDTIEVECLPAHLPESIELDISSLVRMDDVLHVRDVPLPAMVKLAEDPDEPVVKVVAPKAVLAEAAEAEAESPTPGRAAAEEAVE